MTEIVVRGWVGGARGPTLFGYQMSTIRVVPERMDWYRVFPKVGDFKHVPTVQWIQRVAT